MDLQHGPNKLFLIDMIGARHTLQIVSSCIRQDSLIRNFLSFHSTFGVFMTSHSSDSDSENSCGTQSLLYEHEIF